MVFLVVFFLTPSAFPEEDKKRLLFRSLRGQETLSPTLQSSIMKTALQYLAGRRDFELVLSSGSPPAESTGQNFALEGEISKGPQGYHLTLELLDLKNEIRLNRIKQEFIREEDLNRLFRGGLESLFLPLTKPSPPPRSSTNSSSRRNQKSLPSIAVGANARKGINFKNRILSLQQGTDEAIKKKVSQSNEESSASDQNKNSKSSIGFFSDSNVMEENADMALQKKNLNARLYQLSLGGERRVVDTEGIVKTNSNLNIFHASGKADLINFFLGKWSNGTSFTFSSPLETSIKNKKLKVPNLYKLGLYSEYRPGATKSLGLELQREDVVFFNLTNPGGGITPGTLAAYWVGFRGHSTHHLMGREVSFEAALALLAALSTDWQGPIDNKKTYQGTSVRLRVTALKAFYGFDTSIDLSRQELQLGSLSKIELQDFRTSLSLIYRI